jgi:hypothetical protein
MSVRTWVAKLRRFALALAVAAAIAGTIGGAPTSADAAKWSSRQAGPSSTTPPANPPESINPPSN